MERVRVLSSAFGRRRNWRATHLLFADALNVDPQLGAIDAEDDGEQEAGGGGVMGTRQGEGI